MRTLPSLALLLAFPALAPAADSWPQFRGPNGTGLSGSTSLPTKWDEKTNVVWKTKIHDKGWSSPVVWGKQVWLTTAPADGKSRYAICIDRDTGKVVHDVKVFDTPRKLYTFNEFNSHASPSPVIEDGRVYVHFGAAGTACLDTKTGKKLWERTDLLCDHFRGPGSSPILFGDLLFVNFDGYDTHYVVALQKKDGKTRWKKYRTINYRTEDGDLKKAYATCSIVTVKGKPQLVSPAAVGTVAYDPKTGEELWTVYHGGMNAAPPPVYGDGLVFLCTGTGGFRLLGLRPTGSGDVTETHVAWKYNKAVPTRTAPLLLDGLLYMVGEGGIASCLEAKTGKLVWTKRLGGAFTASPIYAGGHLYFFDQNAGKCHVLSPGRDAKVVAVNTLDDGCMATPAVAGKALFVRTKTHLYRIEKKD